jgi:hypothetical protein
MTDEEIILRVFVWVDDHIGELSLDPQPGPVGRLSLSEVLSLMVLHHLLKPFWSLKGYCRWLTANWRHFFPHLVEYSRFTRLFNQVKEFLVVLLKKLSDPNSFCLVADGTALPVMHVRRGPYAKSFRDARKVYCASKNEWYWGFLLELVIDQAGQIAFFSISVAAEIRQLTDILEDLCNRWLLGDKGNRGHKIHERLWQEKQIKIKITNGKERNWIENVIGVLKDKLGLDQIHVRKRPSLIARVTAIFCAYNLVQVLNLPL